MQPFPGNRPSSLDVSLYCPKSAQLSTGGAGRAAFVSKVWHAKMAGDSDWFALYSSLTPAEREELESRKMPTDIVFEDGRALLWKDAHHEVRVGLTRELTYCEPDSPDALTAGTADAYWDPLDGVVYVPDLKANERTSHPESLQLAAYGYALASKTGAHSYVPGIWAAKEGVWVWGEQVEIGSWEAQDTADRLYRAITNTEGDACTGPHCYDCWSRQHCVEWVLPAAALAGTELAVLGDRSRLTHENAIPLIQLCKKLKETGETALEMLKAYADAEGGIYDPTTDKVFRGCPTRGRETVSVAELRAGLGEQAEKYVRRGDDHLMYRWVNAPRPKGQRKARAK